MVLHFEHGYYHSYNFIKAVPILQDSHHPASRPDRLFYHPLMQTELMIIGEMMCIFAFLLSK